MSNLRSVTHPFDSLRPLLAPFASQLTYSNRMDDDVKYTREN